MCYKKYIKKSFEEISQNISKTTKLLAVSKYQPIEKIEYLHSLGQNDFGENYLQELEQKAQLLPNLNWHFIGSIQSRKIKNIVKYASTIQSVEKIEHLEKINTQAGKLEKTIDCYLQINIDNDPNKSGFGSDDSDKVIDCIKTSQSLKSIKVIGLMCLPAKSDNSEDSFISMKSFFDTINSKLDSSQKLTQLSMGMSGDYQEAVKHSSTIVRIGSSLFGKRKN